MTKAGSPVVLVNPGSGGGKVRRFGLVERALRAGARVRTIGAGDDVASLARAAVEQGADVLGVAGGDGTVSAVAAVAAETGRPLVVVPAGTRNHFARDLGLDLRDPARALDALHDAEPVLVDLGFVGSRCFVNNVSFGVYAEALLDPKYRHRKPRAVASIAPRYLGGQRWIDASVDAPGETVECPQIVLVSNNPYHLSTLRCLGRRFTLDAGVLGVVVVKRPAELPAPADLLSDLRQALVFQGSAGTGVINWTAPQVVLHGEGRHLPAGIDGEAVHLSLPVRCEIRPRALRVLLPRNRPGIPEEPGRRTVRVWPERT